MPEETIEYDKIKDYNPTEKTNSLTIQNVPSTELPSVEQLYELSLKLSDNGTFKLIFNSNLNEESISQIKSNLIFSGLTNITSQQWNEDFQKALQLFTTPQGGIYCFVALNGDIYLDETEVSPEHFIHEYTHLLNKPLAKNNLKFLISRGFS